MKQLVFISYSHKDEEIKNRLLSHLQVLEYSGQIELFDTSEITPGVDWSQHIQNAIAEARVALLLISPDFLASEFITKVELPYLLERRENEGLVLIPVIIRPAAWSHVPWLRRLQVWPRDGRSLVEANPTELDRELAELAARVADLAGAVSEEMVSTDILPSPKPKQKDEVEKVAEFFISHDHSDGDFAELLKLRLEKQGHSAWIDIERLRVGEDWRQEIDNAIRSATALVVVMSPSARQSEYVTYEWAYAWGVGVPVIPILLKETSMHPRLESLQYLDFTNRSARPWDRLMDALKNTIEKRNDKSASN